MSTRLLTAAAFLVVLAAGALLGSALVQWRPTETASDSVAVQPQVGERVRVEVLNAGGRDDMAKRATDLLRSRGFDVVYYGNAESFGQDSSRVLDRVGRIGAARAVADALDIRRVDSEVDRNLYLDVTVRLGSEWEPGPARSREARPDTAPWWDPRRFLSDGEEMR